MPFREKGIIAAVQIQKYKNVEGNPHDRNPYNHTPQDTIAYVNASYFLAQIRATVAIAASLAEVR